MTASPLARSTLPPILMVVPSNTSIVEVLRPPVEPGQYTSLAFTETLIDSGIAGSIGSVGDALDNALMESTIGLYKTELIDRQKSWTGRSEVERETASWVHWFNTSRLHSSIGYQPPIEYENEFRRQCSTATSDRDVA
ncbi:transposase InsO family protein [Rhodococcus sp. 27YEA15]